MPKLWLILTYVLVVIPSLSLLFLRLYFGGRAVECRRCKRALPQVYSAQKFPCPDCGLKNFAAESAATEETVEVVTLAHALRSFTADESVGTNRRNIVEVEQLLMKSMSDERVLIDENTMNVARSFKLWYLRAVPGAFALPGVISAFYLIFCCAGGWNGLPPFVAFILMIVCVSLTVSTLFALVGAAMGAVARTFTVVFNGRIAFARGMRVQVCNTVDCRIRLANRMGEPGCVGAKYIVESNSAAEFHAPLYC